MVYAPDPDFYDKDIKRIKKELEVLLKSSYDNATRKYKAGKKSYTKEELDSLVNRYKKEIKNLEVNKKKYGRYGPNYGKNAEGNEAGKKLMELYNAAVSIEVNDFDSSVRNYQAWQKVSDFIKSNKDIRVVARRDAVVKGERGRNVTRQIPVVVDPTKDSTFNNALQENPRYADELLNRFTEEGVITTEMTTNKRGTSGQASTKSYRRVVTNQAELDRRNKVVDAVKTTGVIPETRPTESTGATGTTGATTKQKATGPTSTTTTGPTAVSNQGLLRRAQVPGGFGATKNQPSDGAGPTGPTGGGAGGGGGGGAGGKVTTKLPKNWEAQFRRMFPEQSWLLDLDRSKYPKLFTLIQRGISDRMYETAEGQQRFAAELRNTDFYVELRDTDKVRQIKSLVGDLGFDSVPFNKFLTTASNMGWEGETLQQEVYKEAFRKNDAGQYINPTAVTRTKASNNYLSIANIGKSYFSQVPDSTVENALTGGITTEDVQRQQRELAKTKYGHLANLIDQGFTLDELATPFKQQAASILEKSVDAIDMSQANFEAAYNYGETGQKRMMTSGEWEILLRSDAKYGWDRTENAKREARQLAATISQAFGKVI